MIVTKDECKQAYEDVVRQLITVSVHMKLEQYIELLERLLQDIKFRRDCTVENLSLRYERKSPRAKNKQPIS